MTTHYCDITLNPQLEGSAFFARVLFRMHGFCEQCPDIRLGIDFPHWIQPRSFIGATPGNVLRVFGTKDGLSSFMYKSGLIQMLVVDGITVAGIQPVPSTISGYVQVGRNQRVDRLRRLLSDRSQIRPADTSGGIPESLRVLAERKGLNPAVLMAEEALRKEEFQLRRKSVHMKMRSVSTGGIFHMNLTRKQVPAPPADATFSTYGLANGAAAVPTW